MLISVILCDIHQHNAVKYLIHNCKSNLFGCLLIAIAASISVLPNLIFFSLVFSPQPWRQHKQGDPWPGRRGYHIAAYLGYGGQHQRLLISGGTGDGVTYDDMWLMDPQSGRMEEVRTALGDLSRYS